MSRPFAAVESFLERVLERPAARLFHAHPQPVQLERRIERVMAAHKMVRGGHTYVPSRYRIILNPADLVALQEASDQLPNDLADAILQRARAQGYWLVARPDVVFVPSERIVQGDLEVDAEPLDPSLVSSAAAGLRPVELEGPRPPKPPIPGTGVVPDPVSLPGVPAASVAPAAAEPAPVVVDPPIQVVAEPVAPPWSLAARPSDVHQATASAIEPRDAAVEVEVAQMAPDERVESPASAPWVPQESAVPPADPFLAVPVVTAAAVLDPPAAEPVVASGAGTVPVIVPASPRDADPVALEPTPAIAAPSAPNRTPVPIPVVGKPGATALPGPAGKPEPVMRARIEIQSPDRPPISIDFQGSSLRVGRGTDNEIVISDERVSRHHGRFAARHGVLVYTDLDSTNGSLVNGLRVREAGLGVGDVVRLGRTTLTVRPHL